MRQRYFAHSLPFPKASPPCLHDQRNTPPATDDHTCFLLRLRSSILSSAMTILSLPSHRSSQIQPNLPRLSGTPSPSHPAISNALPSFSSDLRNLEDSPCRRSVEALAEAERSRRGGPHASRPFCLCVSESLWFRRRTDEGNPDSLILTPDFCFPLQTLHLSAVVSPPAATGGEDEGGRETFSRRGGLPLRPPVSGLQPTDSPSPSPRTTPPAPSAPARRLRPRRVPLPRIPPARFP